jgi:hypothetical protein
MPLRVILISIFLIVASNTNANSSLETIKDERLSYTYRICESLNRISDTKFLVIEDTSSDQVKYSISELMHQIRPNVPKEILLQKKPLDLFPDSHSHKLQVRAKMIKAPEIFFYSDKDGKSILKFECKSVIFYRKKVGPFEIPYKTHIIKDPLIQFL